MYGGLRTGEEAMVGFIVGHQYTREHVAEIIGLPEPQRSGGAWMTGYSDWNGSTYIFTNIGVAGRTGHDYANRWDGKSLIWYGKTRAHRGQPQIDRMLSNAQPVHIFWRAEDRSPFTYAGDATALEADDDTPVRVIWGLESYRPGAKISPNDRCEPKWRRGPPPAHGNIQIERVDGPADFYLLRLTGKVDAILDVPAGYSVIKVGMSNNVERRLRELNAGFPPGSKMGWQKIASRHFGDSNLAWQYEGRKLEHLRLGGYWQGGEFAVVPKSVLLKLLKMEE